MSSFAGKWSVGGWKDVRLAPVAGGRSAEEWLEAYGRVHRRDKASMRVIRTLYGALHEGRQNGEGRTIALRTIAQRASRPGDLISHATVRRVVERLATLGLVEITSSDQRGRPFHYRLPALNQSATEVVD